MEEQACQFVEDVTDWEDPRQHLAPFLSAWPAFGKMQAMPTPLALVPHQAEHLYRMGIRFHPELAEVVKVQDAEGVTHWVTPEEVEEMREAGKLSSSDALDLLAKINPDKAAEIASMSDEERAAQFEESAPELADALRELTKLRQALEVANAGSS
ncbi:minor tail protein [Gordonia phage Neville]|uniref:Minor tail protein n=2 Tax=Nevillevirus TaxID=3044773 RepID=A0A515MGX5_9CAUD|nr:minor tail protein [Gordonia phage Neville]YP_010246014.1 minor tail protein [Gordonia phage Trax]AXQ64401.1 minor tail protein [Gordonia phage Neville]QDM55916.1 minor tail protein [Gordonia phage Trax]